MQIGLDSRARKNSRDGTRASPRVSHISYIPRAFAPEKRNGDVRRVIPREFSLTLIAVCNWYILNKMESARFDGSLTFHASVDQTGGRRRTHTSSSVLINERVTRRRPRENVTPRINCVVAD